MTFILPNYIYQILPMGKIKSSDIKGNGDIPNSSNLKTLSQFKLNYTLWFRYELYNNLNINIPMVFLAIGIDENANTL